MLQLDFASYVPASTSPEEPTTIERRWESFHVENPHVMAELERLALAKCSAGATYISIKALWEQARESLKVKHLGTYALNNDFTACYARALIQRHPAIAAVMRTRRRKSEQ